MSSMSWYGHIAQNPATGFSKPIEIHTTPDYAAEIICTWIRRVGRRNTKVFHGGKKWMFTEPGTWPMHVVFTLS